MIKSSRNLIKRSIRKAAESINIDRFSKPALFELDDKLGKYLRKKGGFFIEAGANDGYTQSNTYYLEAIKEWRGILIEPIPCRYRRCVKERKSSIVINCALVSNDYKEKTIPMIYSDLMSLVEYSKPSGLSANEHAKEGIMAQNHVNEIFRFDVPARTLDDILIDNSISNIDFLSLDVEGYEREVLKGMNLDRFRPEFILIEAKDSQEIIKYLDMYNYHIIEYLTHHDILFHDSR